MEKIDDLVSDEPSYWASVGMASVIFGVISFVLETSVKYMHINSDSTGSMLSPVVVISIAVCLVGAFGGMLAVWHYAGQYNVEMELGKGALIGFFTGTGMVLVGIVLSELWLIIDPDFNQKLLDSLIANYEAMEIPEDLRQSMIDTAADQADPSIISQLLFEIPILGILNVLTGMLGVSLFARKAG